MGEVGSRPKEVLAEESEADVLTPSVNETLCLGRSAVRARTDTRVALCLLSYRALLTPPSLT